MNEEDINKEFEKLGYKISNTPTIQKAIDAII